MKRSAFLLPAFMLFAGCSAPDIALDTARGVYPESIPAPAAARGYKGIRAESRSNAAVCYEASPDSMADGANFQAPAGRKMTYSTDLVINVPDTVKGMCPVSCAISLSGNLLS